MLLYTGFDGFFMLTVKGQNPTSVRRGICAVQGGGDFLFALEGDYSKM